MSESMVLHCLPKGLKVQDKVPNSILELEKKKGEGGEARDEALL